MAHPDEHDRALGADNKLRWGYVMANEDPECRGRVRVCVPGKIEPISDWCEVVMPGAGDPRSGAFLPLPLRAKVLVGFILGDVEEPVVFGGVYGRDPQGLAPFAGLTPAQTAKVATIAMGRYAITINSNTDHPSLVIRDEGTPGTSDAVEADPCLLVFDGNLRAVTISSKVAVHVTAPGVAIDGMRVSLQGRPVLTIRQGI